VRGTEGRTARPSKALRLAQAETLLKADEQAQPRIRAYIVVSLLTGARTEVRARARATEMRALRWHDVDLMGQPDTEPLIPPSMERVRSTGLLIPCG
jgi:integrase